MMGAKQLGFTGYEITTAKKQTKTGEFSLNNGSAGAVAGDDRVKSRPFE